MLQFRHPEEHVMPAGTNYVVKHTRFFVYYFTTLYQLHRLNSVHWKDNRQRWTRKCVE